MKIIGEKTETNKIEVEIDPLTFLQNIYDRAIPKGMDYLNEKEGYWYREVSHYHGRDRYVKSRPATQEELAEYRAYDVLTNMIKRLEIK